MRRIKIMQLSSKIFEVLKENLERENYFKDYSSLMISLPSGLSRYAIEIKDYISRYYNGEIYIYADESFGACDIPIDAAKRLNCKLILHFGHTPFINENPIDNIKVIYLPLFLEYDYKKVAEDLLPFIENLHKISLHAPVQYTQALPYLKEEIEKRSKVKVYLGKSSTCQYPGQILGCDVSSFFSAFSDSNKSIEAAIYIGDGSFHYYALLKYLPKEIKVIVYDLNISKVEIYNSKERERFLKRYYALYSLLKISQRIGVLLSTKIGQYLHYGSAIKKAIEEFKREGKEVYIFVADKLEPSQINSFSEKVDILVNFACPRIEDDNKLYSKPIISYTTYKMIEKDLL